MNGFDEACLEYFLAHQEQLLPEPVAETMEEADHNRSAVRQAFEGGNIPSGMPADYREYIGQMQESFGELDTVLGEIDSMTEGELTDRYLVKAVFYSLYFGADRVRLDASDYCPKHAFI